MFLKEIKIFYWTGTLLIFMLFVGCKNSTNFQTKLEEKIKLHCNQSDSCIINMTEVTDFQWDSLYFFAIGIPLEDINKTIGFDFEYWQDLSEHLIFTKSKKVAYYETYPLVDPEKYYFQLINFIIPRDTINFKNYISTSNNNAFFKVKMVHGSEGVYYELTLLNGQELNEE